MSTRRLTTIETDQELSAELNRRTQLLLDKAWAASATNDHDKAAHLAAVAQAHCGLLAVMTAADREGRP